MTGTEGATSSYPSLLFCIVQSLQQSRVALFEHTMLSYCPRSSLLLVQRFYRTYDMAINICNFVNHPQKGNNKIMDDVKVTMVTVEESRGVPLLRIYISSKFYTIDILINMLLPSFPPSLSSIPGLTSLPLPLPSFFSFLSLLSSGSWRGREESWRGRRRRLSQTSRRWPKLDRWYELISTVPSTGH